MKGLGLRSLGANFASTLLRQLFSVALALVTSVLIARNYGADGSGALAVAMLLPATLSTLLNLGLGPACVYHLGSKALAVRDVFLANVKVFFVVAPFGTAVGAVALVLNSETWFPGVENSLLWFALILFPIALFNGFTVCIFQGLQDFRRYNLIGVLQGIVVLASLLIILIVQSQSLWLLVGCHLAGHLSVFCLSLAYILPLGHGKAEPTVGPVRVSLAYGYKAHLSNILAFLNYKADIFLVNFFLGPAQTGIYVVAVMIGERLWMVSQSVSTVLLPRLSELNADEESRRKLTPLVSRWVLLATALVACVVGLFTWPFIWYLYGSEFIHATTPLWCLLPGVVAGSASRVLANDIASRGKPELNFYTSIIVVTVNLSANWILIPLYGLTGAACATSLAYLINLASRLLIYRHLSGCGPRECVLMTREDLSGLVEMFRARKQAA